MELFVLYSAFPSFQRENTENRATSATADSNVLIICALSVAQCEKIVLQSCYHPATATNY